MGWVSHACLSVAVALCCLACGDDDRPSGECAPGAMRACPTGTGGQTCEADGRWGVCEGPPPGDCTPGEIRACPTGAGSQTCGADGVWPISCEALPPPDAGDDASTGGPDAGGADAGSTDAGGGADASAADASGPFACGPDITCDPSTHYCSAFFGGPAGTPPSYGCVALPDACPAPPTCACLAGSGGGCDCADRGGALTVTCAAP